MKRILFFSTPLLLIVQFAFAQTTYTGCVLYDNAGNPILTYSIYTGSSGSGSSSFCGNNATYTNLTNGYYYDGSAKPLNSYCSISPSLTISGDKKFRNCHVFTPSGVACGILKTITVVECSIDNLNIVLVMLSAGFSVVMITPTSKSGLLSFIRKLFGK